MVERDVWRGIGGEVLVERDGRRGIDEGGFMKEGGGGFVEVNSQRGKGVNFRIGDAWS